MKFEGELIGIAFTSHHQESVAITKEVASERGEPILCVSLLTGEETLVQPRTDGTVFALNSGAAENYERIFGHKDFIGNRN